MKLLFSESWKIERKYRYIDKYMEIVLFSFFWTLISSEGFSYITINTLPQVLINTLLYLSKLPKQLEI